MPEQVQVNEVPLRTYSRLSSRVRTGSGATRCYGFRGGCPDGVRAKRGMELGLRQSCPLLAQSGHPDALNKCPLSGVKRT